MHHRRTIALLPTLFLTIPGCQSTPGAATLQDALNAYHAGRYAECHDTAVEVMHASEGPTQEEAAYLAGLSAFRMDDLDEAELRLRMAADAEDPDVAAKAAASLGLVRLEQGYHREAADLLGSAAEGLSGADAAQAARMAATARGSRPATSSRAPAPATTLTTTASREGFVLQAGAFRDRYRAQTVAREIEQRSPVRPVAVIPRRDERGRTLYLVQVGRYATRQEAAVARRTMGRPSYIVAPAVR